MAIRLPKHNSQGYTLLEMLVVLGIASIVIGFAVPSLLGLNKPLRDGTSQLKNHLSLIRSKAISSNQAYRIRPKYPITAQYKGEKYQNTPHNFIVEYAANCQVNTYGTGLPVGSSGFPNGTADGWQVAAQFDLDLPETIGISSTPMTKTNVNGGGLTAVTSATLTLTPANQTTATSVTIDPYLNWNICYDNRGIVYEPVSFTLKDFQDNNKAKTVSIEVQKVGGLRIRTYDKNNNTLSDSNTGDLSF